MTREQLAQEIAEVMHSKRYTQEEKHDYLIGMLKTREREQREACNNAVFQPEYPSFAVSGHRKEEIIHSILNAEIP